MIIPMRSRKSLRFCAGPTAPFYLVAVLGLLAPLGLACGPNSAQPTQPHRASERPGALPPAEGSGPYATPTKGPAWTRDTEQAGAVTDGVAITRVHHEVTDGIQRFMLDFDGAGPVPKTVLENAPTPGKLWLTVHGVRAFPPEVPLLVGEDGQPRAEPLATGSTPVVAYGRTFLGDDSALRFELALEAPRPHRLVASESPRRLTVEFQR
jgi:hypothetical protein